MTLDAATALDQHRSLLGRLSPIVYVALFGLLIYVDSSGHGGPHWLVIVPASLGILVSLLSFVRWKGPRALPLLGLAATLCLGAALVLRSHTMDRERDAALQTRLRAILDTSEAESKVQLRQQRLALEELKAKARDLDESTREGVRQLEVRLDTSQRDMERTYAEVRRKLDALPEPAAAE
jgi:hypothetical protein